MPLSTRLLALAAVAAIALVSLLAGSLLAPALASSSLERPSAAAAAGHVQLR